MGEREAGEAENSGQEAAGSGQKTEIGDQGPATADAASNDHRSEVGSRRSSVTSLTVHRLPFTTHESAN